MSGQSLSAYTCALVIDFISDTCDVTISGLCTNQTGILERALNSYYLSEPLLKAPSPNRTLHYEDRTTRTNKIRTTKINKIHEQMVIVIIDQIIDGRGGRNNNNRHGLLPAVSSDNSQIISNIYSISRFNLPLIPGSRFLFNFSMFSGTPTRMEETTLGSFINVAPLSRV